PNPFVYLVVFFSTICSYNFYWLLSKWYFATTKLIFTFFKSHLSFFIIFLAALIGACYFLVSVSVIIPYVFWGMVFTLLYSLPLWPLFFSKKLQRIGFFKTILLAFTWAYVTTILPAVSLLSNDFFTVLILFAARFFFMLLLCIIFDKRDITVDKTNGLHSLATDTHSEKLTVIINIVFVAYFIMGLLLRYHFNDKSQMFAFLITGGFVWFVYTRSRKKQGYLFYYFLVDGLMLISAVASYLASQV
ncbi:MAG: hypothetical protein ACKVOM_01165, partial [Ferruginibacter sp.]